MLWDIRLECHEMYYHLLVDAISENGIWMQLYVIDPDDIICYGDWMHSNL
jgi:hypothetical protein